MSNLMYLSEDDFNKEITSKDQLLVVDFYADWCMPCKMLTPILEELSDDNSGKAKIGKLNVDEARSAAMKYGISSIPCVIFFKNGEEVNRVIGLRAKEDLQSVISSLA